MKIMRAAEDYLEAMLMMKEKHGYIRSIDVADYLGVTKPSVSYATKRLRESGYITMDKDGLITLNDSGLQIASSRPEDGRGGRLPHGARHQPTDLRGHLRPCCEIPAAAEGTRGSGGEKINRVFVWK